MTAHPVIAAAPPTVRVTLPLKTVTEGNAKEHWRTKSRRAKSQRKMVKEVVYFHMLAARMTPIVTLMGYPSGLVVTLTRISPSTGLDPHDNLPGSQKHVVDAIAVLLGVDDRDPRVEWKYDQRRGSPKDLTLAKGYGVCVEISAR